MIQDKEQEIDQAKRIVEALLFSSDEPIPFRKINEILNSFVQFEKDEVRKILAELGTEYEQQNRAYRLEEIAKGFLLRTCKEFSPYIHALLKKSRPEKLTQAATEVLAIIAYKQPITRPQIDDIRGVDSSGIMHTLLDRGLIEAAGKLEVPGRPMLYKVSQHFLKHFGLRDVNDLPPIGNTERNCSRSSRLLSPNLNGDFPQNR